MPIIARLISSRNRGLTCGRSAGDFFGAGPQLGRAGAYIRAGFIYIAALTQRNDQADNTAMTQWMTDNKPENQSELAVKPRARSQRPPMYKVLMLNDDFTPMEFVVHVLERLFNMTHAQAIEIMLTVHRKGVAVVGVFSHEIAETKVAQVMELARRQQHPLQCTMEKE